MSRLDRLLFNPDTDEWKNYKRGWFLGNRNLSGVVVLVILVSILGYIGVRFYQINSKIPRGIPEEYYLLSLYDIYALTNDIAVEENREVRFLGGALQVYPEWQKSRNPVARLSFLDKATNQRFELDAEAKPQSFAFTTYSLRSTYLQPGTYIYETSDAYRSLPAFMDSDDAFETLQNEWGNQILFDNKYISWPAILFVWNVTKTGDPFSLEWQLCYRVGFVEPGKEVCSSRIYSSGTQLVASQDEVKLKEQ
jgi:hypothetical protein